LYFNFFSIDHQGLNLDPTFNHLYKDHLYVVAPSE